MHCHRVNEVIELLQPYWLKHAELSLVEVLAQLAKEAGHEGELSQVPDDLIIYHLKMRETPEGDMIPGIKKDCEDDFKTALLKARGLVK
ncbi:YihD family protein [Motilimonas eburnea]|uniref:YihD family protein n=1 Tax=Motilimonas eburnea TaxID=1737488 RepID=UPI001E2BE7D3|nr:YihD family protein [Motilimonas eburnea]MCE2572413.1 YihD family protein [Motilimonas eburnea]